MLRTERAPLAKQSRAGDGDASTRPRPADGFRYPWVARLRSLRPWDGSVGCGTSSAAPGGPFGDGRPATRRHLRWFLAGREIRGQLGRAGPVWCRRVLSLDAYAHTVRKLPL